LAQTKLNYKINHLDKVVLIFSRVIQVEGQIKDRNNNYIPYCKISSSALDRESSYSDSKGYFTVILNDSNPDLIIEHISFQKKNISVKEKDQFLSIVLKEKRYTEEDIIIYNEASLSNRNITTNSLNPSISSLNKLPQIISKDLLKSIQFLPGFESENAADAKISIRGIGSDKNLVILDGINIYHIDHLFGFYSAFNPNIIRDVKISKGVFSSKYGGKLSGLIEFTSKNSGYEDYKLNLGLNFLSANAELEIPFSNTISLLLSGRHSVERFLNTAQYDKIVTQIEDKKDDFSEFRSDSLEITKSPSFKFYDLHGKISILASKRDIITMNYFKSFDHLNENESIEIFKNGKKEVVNIDRSQTEWGNTGYSLQWFRKSSNSFNQELYISTSKYTNDFIRDNTSIAPFPQDYISKNILSDFKIKLENTWQLNSNNRFLFGTEYLSSEIKENSKLTEQENRTQLTSLFLENNYRYLSWVLRTGFRYSYYNQNDKYYLSPRINLSHQTSENAQLYINIGRFYQFNFKSVSNEIFSGLRDQWYYANNININVESANKYGLGFIYKHENFSFDFELYYEKQFELNSLNEFSSEISPKKNIYNGLGKSLGYESLIVYTEANYSLSASYSFNSSKKSFSEINNGNYFYSRVSGGHQLKLSYQKTINDWQFTALMSIESGKQYTSIGSITPYNMVLEPIHFANVSISKKVRFNWVNLNFGINIYNLYNSEYIIRRTQRRIFNDNIIIYNDTKLLPFLASLNIDISL
jgi:ferric enterobactin receptor